MSVCQSLHQAGPEEATRVASAEGMRELFSDPTRSCPGHILLPLILRKKVWAGSVGETEQVWLVDNRCYKVYRALLVAIHQGCD
jgi:hypothetical protein